MERAQQPAEAPLKKRQILMISLPDFATFLMRGPSNESIIQGIYAAFFGIDLVAIGTILLVTKIFDALLHPFVGVGSDRAHHKTGTRKPWLLAGTIVSLLGMWFLYNPPTGIGATYFTMVYLIAYLGWTLAEVPYGAWKAEVTHDYRTRTHIAATDTVTTVAGTVAFALIPIVMASMGLVKKTEHSPDTLRVMSYVVVLALPLFTALALLFVPNGKPIVRESQATLKETWRAVIGCRPLLMISGTLSIVGIVVGFNTAVSYLYAARYLHAGELIVYVGSFSWLVTLASIPVGAWMCNHVGKHKTLAIAISLGILGTAAADFLVDHSDPNQAVLQARVAFLVISIIGSGTVALIYVSLKAMMGDLADYGQWKFGSNFTGAYIVVLMFGYKITNGVASFLALWVLKQFGFDAANSAEITLSAAWGMRLTYSWIPFVVGLVCIPLLFRYPINRRRHDIIVRALKRRAKRQAAAEAVPTSAALQQAA